MGSDWIMGILTSTHLMDVSIEEIIAEWAISRENMVHEYLPIPNYSLNSQVANSPSRFPILWHGHGLLGSVYHKW